MEKTKKPFNVKLFYRRTCLIIYDVISVVLASYVAILWRYDFHLDTIPEHFMRPIELLLPFNILATLGIFYIMRLYSSLWAFAGETELQNIVVACVLSMVVDGIGLQFFKIASQAVPRSYYPAYMAVLVVCIFASRFSYRFFRGLKHKQQNKKNM
ncbi:MAG: polysaccharide biosynthesis protein, partial [Lachnospiraceae bacterium]|nr:polysaccharide biosynthesis protein [Lachnospiraceae bacterium]